MVGPASRANSHAPSPFFDRAGATATLRFIGERDQQSGPSTAAIERFDEILYPDVHWIISPPQPPQDPEVFLAIDNAQFAEWQARYRNLAMEAYAFRDSHWQPDTSSLANYQRWSSQRRQVFLDTIGRYPAPTGPMRSTEPSGLRRACVPRLPFVAAALRRRSRLRHSAGAQKHQAGRAAPRCLHATRLRR